MTIEDVEFLYDEEKLDLISDSLSPYYNNILEKIISNLCRQVSDRETFIQILLKLYHSGKENNFKDLDAYLEKIKLSNPEAKLKQDYGSLIREYYDYIWCNL